MPSISACLLALLIFFSFEIEHAHTKNVSLKTTIVSLTTDHGILQAEIHFDERDALLAQKVETIIKNDLIKVINYFGYVPRDLVHFNVDPYMRLSNGNARVFTSSVINLYNFPADHSDHLVIMEDWLRGLVFHEFVHITHLDQTRGFLDDGRKIFGSIAKLPTNIVPRWFTEGIAVWAESHLLNKGRLSNQLFRKELLIQFLKEEYCETIDCLDEPGVYPHGQLAYWAGSHFIEYLEQQKPGTVKCLVEMNSGVIPFFLNQAFEQCTEKTAQEHFEDFRKKLISDANPNTPEAKETWGDKVNNAFGSDNFQKGIVLDGEFLYKVENNRYTEALMSYDLSEPGGLSLIKQFYKFPIADISGIVQMTSQEGEAVKYLVVSFFEDTSFRKSSKQWKLVNAETLLIERNLKFKNDPSYVLALGNNRYITASYIDNVWKIEKQKLNEFSEVIEVDVLHTFGPNVNLVSIMKADDKIFVKINEGETSTLLMSEVTLEKFYEVYRSKELFEFVVVDTDYLVLYEKGKHLLFEFNNQNVTVSTMARDHLKNVTFAQVQNDRVLYLENRLKTKAMTKAEGLKFLKDKAEVNETKTLAPFEIKQSTPDLSTLKTENYPQLYHLSPNYWFLATGSGENISSIGAMTTLNDPMNLHVLDASAVIYPSISKLGGSLTYTHKLSSIDDLWTVNAFFDQEYSRSEINNSLMDSREWGLGTAYKFLNQRWTYVPGIFVANTTSKDFLSDRSTTSPGMRHVLLYDAKSFEDLFQTFVGQLKVQQDYPDRGEQFLNFQARALAVGRFSDRLEMGVQSAYGKLVKNDFSRGVLYGGGIDSVATTRLFEFYGLPYSNAYGNEIFTFRFFGEYNFWNIYRGKNFIPIFFKEAHLLLGRETLYADRIFLDKSLIREKAINAFFGGLRMKTNLFYYVPTDIDLIFSSTRHPAGRSVQAVNFSINADLF